jgi:O-antigen/teichoic acid export membrane protein
MTRHHYLKGGIFLVVGSVISAACVFARNVTITHLISLEDYGIASTFGLAMTLLEMASNLAIDRLIVQAKDNDALRLVASGHAFQIARGLLGTLLLFLTAGFTATLFGVPQVAWAFQAIAFAPLIRSFSHLGAAIQQRDMRFGPSVWIDIGPQLIVTILTAPLALWLGDYRVMIILVFAQAMSSVVVSHLVAGRPYRLDWDRRQVRRMVAFGWPLLLNGFLMFAIFQGDEAIIGASKGMENLAWYGVAFSLALAPSLLVMKVLTPFMMPLLARKQDDHEEFERRSVLTVQICMLAGLFVGLMFVLAGPSLLIAIYGSKYAAGATVIGWFGIMQGARILKSGPAIVALARGETTNPLIANLVRCIGLALALAAVALGKGAIAVAICGMVGEVLAALTAILLLRFRLGLRLGGMLGCAAISATAFTSAQAVALRWFHGTSPTIEIVGGATIGALLCLSVGAVFPQVLTLTLHLLNRVKARRAWLARAAGN